MIAPPNSPRISSAADAENANFLKVSRRLLILVLLIIVCAAFSSDYRIGLIVLVLSIGVAVFSFKIQANNSLICVAEVCIDQETNLTIRSWWPSHLPIQDVETYGRSVALQNANRWIFENRGLPETSLYLDIETAKTICNDHISVPCNSETSEPCSVCFENLNNDCCSLKYCRHNFHVNCLSEWFNNSSKLFCPLCRTDHSELVPSECLPQEKPKNRVEVIQLQILRGRLPRHSPYTTV
jgi:Ring finger domain